MSYVLVYFLPEVEVIIMTPHHYPLGKGWGSGTLGPDPLKVMRGG